MTANIQPRGLMPVPDLENLNRFSKEVPKSTEGFIGLFTSLVPHYIIAIWLATTEYHVEYNSFSCSFLSSSVNSSYNFMSKKIVIILYV